MQGTNPLEGLSVLVVEDAAYVRRALMNMLCRIGKAHSVEEASCGEEALKKLGSDTKPSCDVMICDLNMEGMTGLELIAETIKRYGDNRPAVVVVSSYMDDETAVKELKDMGVTIMLGKPVLAGQLVEAVAKAVGRTLAA